jgi:hypothetical protein
MTKTRHRDGTAHEAQLASGCGANRVVEWWPLRCRSRVPRGCRRLDLISGSAVGRTLTPKIPPS